MRKKGIPGKAEITGLIRQIIHAKRTLFRSDNKRVWVPFLLDIIGQIISGIALMVIQSGTVHFLIIALFAILFFVFLVLSLEYVYKWHGIISILQNYPSLSRTCAFLAKMKTNDALCKSNGLKVNKFVIEYSVEAPVDVAGTKYYPLCVNYTLYGDVTNPEFQFYYHALTHKHSALDLKASIQINDMDPFELAPRLTSYGGDIAEYHLRYASIPAKINDKAVLSLCYHLNGERGISTADSDSKYQRLLFYPRNLTDNLSENTDANIVVKIPNDIYKDFTSVFNLNIARINTNDSHKTGTLECKRKEFNPIKENESLKCQDLRHYATQVVGDEIIVVEVTLKNM